MLVAMNHSLDVYKVSPERNLGEGHESWANTEVNHHRLLRASKASHRSLSFGDY